MIRKFYITIPLIYTFSLIYISLLVSSSFHIFHVGVLLYLTISLRSNAEVKKETQEREESGQYEKDFYFSAFHIVYRNILLGIYMDNKVNLLSPSPDSIRAMSATKPKQYSTHAWAGDLDEGSRVGTQQEIPSRSDDIDKNVILLEGIFTLHL